MMKHLLKLLPMAVLFVGTCASADIVHRCTLDGDERIISVVYPSPGQAVPCAVTYERGGEMETLWRAQNEEGFCEEQAEKFIAQQVAWGWSCERNGDEDAEPVTEDPDYDID